MTTIRFHIGAHKTATTHLQETLARSTLEVGTRYVPLKILRRTLTSALRKQRLHLSWHRWYQGTWLLSDENMLGTTRDALSLYPDAAPALRHFLDCELSIFLCVRSYDSFLASAYGETLWRHAYRPFPAQMPQRRWPDLVADLQRQLPGITIHTWQYEHYRQHSAAILQFYANDRIRRIGQSPDPQPKSGFSANAVQAMSCFDQRRPRRADVLAIRSQFPASATNPRFDPWSTAQRQQLRAWYAEDLERLALVTQCWQPPAVVTPAQIQASN